ncbi:hypothetical protein V2J09_018544 [Rumex salicifolius]
MAFCVLRSPLPTFLPPTDHSKYIQASMDTRLIKVSETSLKDRKHCKNDSRVDQVWLSCFCLMLLLVFSQFSSSSAQELVDSTTRFNNGGGFKPKRTTQKEKSGDVDCLSVNRGRRRVIGVHCSFDDEKRAVKSGPNPLHNR